MKAIYSIIYFGEEQTILYFVMNTLHLFIFSLENILTYIKDRKIKLAVTATVRDLTNSYNELRLRIVFNILSNEQKESLREILGI